MIAHAMIPTTLELFVLVWSGYTDQVASRRLRHPDRQNVVYAAVVVVVMPRSWKRVCMLIRRVS